MVIPHFPRYPLLMQKRMKSAHPRTPGGRQETYEGRDGQPKPGTYSKFQPVKQFKKPVIKPAKVSGDKASM